MKREQLTGFNPESIVGILNAAISYRDAISNIVDFEANTPTAKYQISDYLCAKATVKTCINELITRGYIVENGLKTAVNMADIEPKMTDNL